MISFEKSNIFQYSNSHPEVFEIIFNEHAKNETNFSKTDIVSIKIRPVGSSLKEKHGAKATTEGSRKLTLTTGLCVFLNISKKEL